MSDRAEREAQDAAFAKFSRWACAYYGFSYTPPAERPKLVAVTPENAREFTPAPRKRGRPRKIDARDNVVPIGAARAAKVAQP